MLGLTKRIFVVGLNLSFDGFGLELFVFKLLVKKCGFFFSLKLFNEE